MTHPEEVLFRNERAPVALAACEHYAGNEKFILKALALQAELGPVFDITCDCEDGATAGAERQHAQLVARLINSADNRHRRAGARLHDPSHDAFRQDVDILLGEAGSRIAYLTVPKPVSFDQAAAALDYIRGRAEKAGLKASPPIHVLVETQCALRDIFRIAALPGLEALAFGLLDFVSDHRGAIPAGAMRSPGQFDHRLIARAKAEIVAAALLNGLVPTHNPCFALDDPGAPRSDAARAHAEFGFLRMYSIHPAQILPIVETLRPALADVERAAEILLAAGNSGWGPVRHGGEMHDRASYRYFWDLLKRARTTGMRLPDAAERIFFSKAA